MNQVNAAGRSVVERLPYGPRLSKALRPIQRGFLAVNGLLVAPALRIGLGRFVANRFTGRLMLLRTRGRRTGRIREAPLGYVVRDGAVWCVAGYGRATPWYRNLVADPSVEVVLPDRTFRAVATAVEDPVAWSRAFRDLVRSFGVIGRLVVGRLDGLSDEQLVNRYAALPIVRIVPSADELRSNRSNGGQTAPNDGIGRRRRRSSIEPARNPTAIRGDRAAPAGCAGPGGRSCDLSED